MPKPHPSTVRRCHECGKSIGGKGWFGPECQCGRKAGNALKGAPSVGTMR